MEKAATAPFRFFANAFGGKEEDYKQIDFNYLQTSVQDPQKKTLDNLARVLTEKPALKLQLLQVSSRQDEDDAIELVEAKKQYLNILSDSLTTTIQNRIDSLASNDSLFNVFVNSKLPSGAAFMSIGEKCTQLIGKAKVDSMQVQIMGKRNSAVTEYLIQQKQIPAERLQVSIAPDDQLSRGQLPKFVVNISANL